MRRTSAESAQTRTALLESALLTFADRGVATTTLSEVAAAAGLTRGALYHHFADKHALYTAVIAESWESITGPVWAVLDGAGPREERFALFLTTWLRQLREDRRFRALLTIVLGSAELPAMSAAEKAAKADGLAEWASRLELVLRDPGATRSLVAWLCGTAVLAACAPQLLPSADADGIASLCKGFLP